MPKRSLLQLDVKGLAGAPPPLFGPARPMRRALRRLRDRLRRAHVISVAVVAASAVYLLTIAPSDSTATETANRGPAAAETVGGAEIIADDEIVDLTESAEVAPETAAAVDEPAENAAAESPPLILASLGPANLRPAVPNLDDAPPPAAAPAITPENETTAPAPDWTTATVERGDTLSQIFKRHGLKVADAYAVANLAGAEALRAIRPGQDIRLAADAQGALTELRYQLAPLTTLRITRDGDAGTAADAAEKPADDAAKLTAETITRAPQIKLRSATAVINSSLLAAAKDAGLAQETVYEFAHLFDWQVDFAREIRRGDRFSVIYQARFLDGEKIGDGDIIAAELFTAGRHLRAVRHVDEHGRRNYFAPNGDGIQRSFLRSPVEFGRVTSNFSPKRFHPILKRWQPHRGVDYGAPRGTPVRATGDGVVASAKRRYGYGKTVIIRHGEKYTTLYAHLSGYAKDIKAGARVAQGQVIGYVGATGWATGPHLHYEFRVGGVHQNPLTVELPKSDPIAARYRADFVAEAATWVAKLAQIDGGQFAQLDLDAAR